MSPTAASAKISAPRTCATTAAGQKYGTPSRLSVKTEPSHSRCGSSITAWISALVLCGAVATQGTLTAQSNRPVELSSSVGDGFTIAVVGDVIIAHSLEHMMSNPGFAEVARLLQSVDVATGNLETQIIDGRTFVGSRGGGRHGAEPESAEWLKRMGFDIVARRGGRAATRSPLSKSSSSLAAKTANDGPGTDARAVRDPSHRDRHQRRLVSACQDLELVLAGP